MPRLRSQTRITSVLPRELLQRSLEFLPVHEVYGEAKLVSREFLSTARRALTRGRWRPIKLFSEESERHWEKFENGVDLSSSHETFKAVWALVAPWLDPHTQTKIQIFGAGLEASGAAAALRAEIDDENLPAFLGGACRCPGGCVPVPQALRTRGGYAVSATYED